jgi:hypothetical protein
MKQMGITEAFLREALRKTGCPLCRICREAESRYLRFLLHENINDVSTRIEISRSMGFCRQHSWQLLKMEIEQGIVPLGTSIIYEDLVGQVIKRMEAALSAMTDKPDQRNRPHLIDRIRRWTKTPDKKKRHFLEPIKACRICESVFKTAQHTVHVMNRMLYFSEIQQMYVKSDGICLSHLRLALSLSDMNPGFLFLINNTVGRLIALQRDLNEFKRKQHWHHRHEAISESEKTAVKRSVTFFAGEE